MPSLAEIEEQIRNLSSSELAEFRKWYAEFDAHAWDRQFESDVNAGRLDALADAARHTHTIGRA